MQVLSVFTGSQSYHITEEEEEEEEEEEGPHRVCILTTTPSLRQSE